MIFYRICMAWALSVAITGFAQSPLPEDAMSAAGSPQSVSSPSPSATAAVEPPSLIPPNRLPGRDSIALPSIPASPELEQLNAFFRQSSLGKEADEHRLHVQLAALETRLRNDEELRELRARAWETKTDLERRHRLWTYYKRYYEKLRARADSPDLQTYVDAQSAAHLYPLLQPRVRHETDEAELLKLTTARAGTPVGPLPTPAQAKVNDAFRPQ